MVPVKFLSILILLLILFSCSGDTSNPDPINNTVLNIPDTHFEEKLIELGIDTDGVVNRQILRTDAENVTRLDLNLLGNFGVIADLKGIEGFVNLTFLSAAGHNLTEADLSSNTKLDTVYLGGNQLSSIDLSHNQNLVHLDVQSNELTSLYGISEATKLKSVNVSWNNLEEVSIVNTSLEDLLMTNNRLKLLDITGAPNLKSVLLTSNELATIDLSTNTQLETLLLSDNWIGFVNLESLRNLTYLYITSNVLKGLDVSYNSELLDLRVDRNPGLNCIRIGNGQKIPKVSLSEYQELSNNCN